MTTTNNGEPKKKKAFKSSEEGGGACKKRGSRTQCVKGTDWICTKDLPREEFLLTSKEARE